MPVGSEVLKHPVGHHPEKVERYHINHTEYNYHKMAEVCKTKKILVEQ